jgi:hypothetical protein
MIEPTVGRRVWYWPKPEEKSFDHDQPFDAGIVHVYAATLVNLDVRNEYGFPLTGKVKITLAQDREAKPGECGWMPYQRDQAARSHSSA